MKVDVLDLFSGCGGFSLGLSQAGFDIKNHYFSEIDKYAIANYKHNFKKSKYVGSVENVSGIKADIVTFGSPCQDFSLAGKRKGMDGARSSLILEAIRIIRETRPSVFIWENVKGAFSSNSGADFWGIIAAFADIGGYRLEWQLLNTSWVLPQNRERIYLIGHLAERSEPGVFPFRETDFVHNRTGETTQEVHSDNRIALTQQARQFASWNGDFVKVYPITEQRTENAKKQRRETGSNNFRDKEIVVKNDGLFGSLLGSPTIDNSIVITTNTEKGFDVMTEKDSLNLSVPTSKTRRGRIGKGRAQTLDTQANQAVLQYSQIRRLTEIECERLQGFPDNWTKYGNFDGETKEISKTQRYKMLGNAVTATVVQAIGERLIKQMK